jgi:cyclopropane fatty-acyl-phospholipid synthase-like methyltransferase
MSDAAATSYDELPYGNYIFHFSHPDRLATMAMLLGMSPPPVDRCRVLELGCGTGANLIAMALTLPQSRFVGVDLSGRQIAMGQETIQSLGLANVELKAMSLTDVDESFDQFDYILCHGVYSWVPEPVQDRILTICAQNLAAQGVAYVSYNTYPGWHMRGMVREMMRYHARQFDQPQTRVQQARALLAFLLESVSERKTVYCDVLQAEADLLRDAADTYIYHEHLEEVNYPLWFHQFAERVAAKGLQYLAEAQPALLPGNLSPRVRAAFEQMATDLIHAEQYLDFVRNRTFRRSLLCHQAVALQRPPAPRAVTAMSVTGLVKPVTESPDLAAGAAVEFRTADRAGLISREPLTKAALLCLWDAAPRAVPFAALWDLARARLTEALGPDAAPADPAPLADVILQCFLSNLVELHVHAPDFTLDVSQKPVGSPLARLQAEQTAKVHTLRHRTVELNDLERLLLERLDGRHDRAALLEGLMDAVAQGECEMQHQGQPLRDRAKVREVLGESLEPSLRRLAYNALLVS